jgi:PAS domain S-box-containing protein
MRVPPNEQARLQKLKSLRILDTEPEELFDGLTKLAAEICQCPIVFLSLIDSDRQWFKSRIGFTTDSTPREVTFCAETILGSSPLVIADISQDIRFATHPLVQAPIHARFYAGTPIITKDNFAIGTLCVLNTNPHQLSSTQLASLVTLAEQAARHIETRAELTVFQAKVNALGESERRFRTIADASPMLLWISDEAGNRTFFNQAWCEFTGLSREDSIADHWMKSIHPDDREVYNRKWEETSQQKIRFQQEFRLRHCSGTYRWVLEQAMPMFSSSGRLEGYVSSCVDLSSRMTDELQYQNNEARFRAISEAAPLGIFVTDSDGNYIYTNIQFQKITGQTAEESFGSGWQRALADEDRERVAASWFAATRTAQPFEEVYRFRKPNGEIAWASVKAAAINSTDTVSGWVGTVEDITARLKADSELVEAKQSAEAATHAKGQFLANMSHEIRTPLTAIIGFAEALRDERNHTADELHCLDVIVSNGRHLLEVLNGILDLSKIDAGALTIERTSFPLIDVIEEIRMMFAPRIAEKALSFSVKYQWPLPAHIITDPLRLKQVLINLLSNAIKFTDNGWIELTVSFDPSERRLSFTIGDSGIGIAPEQIEKLFRPFSQANESITRQFGGTGLGLTISSHLVHALGGTIEVTSNLGQGSTFSFWITPDLDNASPFINQLPSEESSCEQPTTTQPKLSGKVLFADDALDNRRLVDHLLRKVGIESVLVEDGQQAITTALSEQFDLILLDVQMPNVDGLSAARALRQAGIRTPIVSLSAGAFTSDVLRAIEAGCSMHLAKPFTRESFFDMLQRFLESPESNSPRANHMISTKLSDDAEMNQLLLDFIDSLGPRIDDLVRACGELDWPTIEARAHKLRGSAGLYGYGELSALAEQLETLAKQRAGEPSSLTRQLTALCQRIEAGRELTAGSAIASHPV